MSTSDLLKWKTEWDKQNLIPLLEMFIRLKFPDIKNLEVKYDKADFIWIKFDGDDNHSEESIKEELDKLKKEVTHYASHK